MSAATRRAWWGGRGPEADSYFPGEYYRPPASAVGMNEALHLDLVSFLPGDILVKVDRAAMANSLETRAPFLDRDLVEYALSLPSTLKVKNDETKIVFKEACAQYWPPALRTRGKQGFAAPFQSWLAFPNVAALVARVFAPGSRLRELLPGLPADQHQHRSYETWTLLTLGMWLEEHVSDHVEPLKQAADRASTVSTSRAGV